MTTIKYGKKAEPTLYSPRFFSEKEIGRKSSEYMEKCIHISVWMDRLGGNTGRGLGCSNGSGFK